MSRRVTMGLLFYPRGGSAQVIRYLAAALKGVGWSPNLVCGSLGESGERTHAETFFSGMEVTAADYGPAVAAFEAGRDPVAEPFGMHPSFEDRPDVPDRLFAAVSPELGNGLTAAWAELIERSGLAAPEVLHLHHLTPLQEAFSGRFPDTPLVTHLHGTDLKMIDRAERLTRLAEGLGTDLAAMADRAAAGRAPAPAELPETERELAGETRWEQWRYAAHWLKRLRAAAGRSDRFIVISPHEGEEAARLLDIKGEQVTWIPNGVDTELFDRRPIEAAERLARWREWLVTDARGWAESGEPGSVRATEAELEAFTDHESGEPSPVLLFVGRFLDFKRVPLLVRAYARARPRFERRAPLVIWGGFPGEWEGEHPHTLARRLGVEDVFFAGWHGHTDLARGLPCAEVMVAPSHNEPFGQVFLEAMAAGLPVIATNTGGPLSFVNTEPGAPNGWIVEADDEDSLAGSIVEAVNDTETRRARSNNAYSQIRAGYAWSFLTERFVAVYEEAIRARG
ncbi:MAG: glycosyltransferase family 4 protein [Thermoleophilaceae bacterium]|nr:glycosyltransferase family 4 protein [Thermoleophilaceae bacterium]